MDTPQRFRGVAQIGRPSRYKSKCCQRYSTKSHWYGVYKQISKIVDLPTNSRPSTSEEASWYRSRPAPCSSMRASSAAHTS